MNTVKDIIYDYLSSFNAVLDSKGPVGSFINSWACLTLVAQINLNRHSNKNKNDRDKLDFLFRDYRKNIALMFRNKNNLANLKNILSIVESGCPILITRFEDIKDEIKDTGKIFKFAVSSDAFMIKKADYFMTCLVSLIHLGKNKLFKSFALNSLSGNYESYDIRFCENASQLIFNIITEIVK